MTYLDKLQEFIVARVQRYGRLPHFFLKMLERRLKDDLATGAVEDFCVMRTAPSRLDVAVKIHGSFVYIPVVGI